MGGLRAAVGVVLGVISLAVLSLHIALCIHYPSPLFAVTLLLNPSLWLFLGLIGMGCALLLTHRDQQRKVRAGHCTSCHPQYGSTVDTKWRAQDAKWRSGQPQCQRGPSRAIYSYNGNLHKFYASYGTINEKQLIEMKHSALKTPSSSNSNGKTGQCPSEETNGIAGIQNDVNCSGSDSGGKNDLENSTEGLKVPRESEDAQLKEEKDNDCTDEKLSSQEEGKLPMHKESNHSSVLDSKSNDEMVPGKEIRIGRDESHQNSSAKTTNTVDAVAESSPLRRTPQEMRYREAKYCDCMARYGAVYHYSQLPRAALSPRCDRYGIHDNAISRYNRKLMMRCKLKQPNDVPVDLFAAKGVSSVRDNDKDHNGKSKDITQSSGLEEKCDCHNDGIRLSQKPSQVSEEDVSSAGCTDTTSLSSVADLSASKESMNPHTTVSSNFIVPLKHMSRFSAQTSTSLPLGSPYNGKSKQIDQLEDHESTSLSSEQTASEQDLQDQDGVSISSKSSLLPSSPEKSMTSKDLTRSPLWRPFKSSIIGRKRLSDEDRSSNEDSYKSQHSKGYAAGQDSTNEDSHESPTTTLKSVFTTKKSFSKFAGEGRKISMFNKSNSNENVSSESTSSSASPALKEKKRQQSDSSRSAKSKTSFSRKLSSSKSQSLQKNSKTLLMSPAKAVRSLVFRNAQKRTSKVRKAPDDKTQHGEFTPAKLPLLSSPNTEPCPLESSINAAKPLPTENSSDSSGNVNLSTLTSPAGVSSISALSISNSNSTSQASSCSANSAAKSSTISQGGVSTKEQLPKGSSRETSTSNFAASESNFKTPLLSSPAISSTSPAAAPTTQMASSSSPCGSPSVRPKEPKKPKIRLKGKHRSRASESIMLLTADSDE